MPVLAPLPERPPRAVRLSHLLWLGAIATALVELGGRLAQDPQGFVSSITGSGTELGLRFAAYALLLTLSLLMRSGRGWARRALLVVFGGLGTFSLIFEPVGWLMAGGSAATFLAKADAATWAMILSRVAHLLCVWGAILLMFAPTAHAFFTRRPALGLQA